MVGDGLDWVRVFGYGLEMGDRGCTCESGLKMRTSGLKMSGSGCGLGGLEKRGNR